MGIGRASRIGVGFLAIVCLCALATKMVMVRLPKVDWDRPFEINGMRLDMNSDEIIENVGDPIKKAPCTELLFEERCNIWDFPAGCRVKFLGERWAIGIKGHRLSQGGHILVGAGDEIEKLDSLLQNRKYTKMKQYLLVDCVYFAQGGVWGPSPRAASLAISSMQGRCDAIYLMTAHCSLQELDGSSADSKTHK